uniref:Protein UL41A n=1 Tax=Heterorhabditis bacteriophora TaxID=37862 RepID=A0A1I7XCB8_HETBA
MIDNLVGVECKSLQGSQQVKMFVPQDMPLSASSTLTSEIPIVTTKELTVICLLFVAVIVFQFYVYIKLDDVEEHYQDRDKRRREEERKKRNDLLMKALSAF